MGVDDSGAEACHEPEEAGWLKEGSAVCGEHASCEAGVKACERSAMSKKPDPRLKRAGVSGYNKPKRTPNHPTKSHIVVAKQGDKIKTIRFGQQGKTGSKPGTARNKSFRARHAKNIARGPMSGAYWANKTKWSGKMKKK